MAKALPLFAVDTQAALAENAPLMLHTRLEEIYRFAPLIGDPAEVEALHNMRIAAKRLRYTMEIFAACILEPEFDKLYGQVKTIQEHIGEIHDADIRIPLLQDFLDRHAVTRPEIRIGLENLILAQQKVRSARYRQFVTYWRQLQKRGFKRRFLQMLVPASLVPVEDSNREE